MAGSTPRMVWKQPFMLSVTMSSNSSGVVSDAGLADRARAAGDVDQDVDAAEGVAGRGRAPARIAWRR